MRTTPVLLAPLVAGYLLVAGQALADAPSKAECEQVFTKEKSQMNACVEKKCRGKDQQAFQECHAGCAQERSDRYQSCYAKYVLDW